MRDDLGTFVQSGVPVSGTLYYQAQHGIVTGGDFRIAFYTDGTVRAKLLVLNYTPMYSSNVPFCYEGKYALSDSGELSTAELPLVNRPSTMLKLEDRMTMMRLSGRYDKAKDEFTVQVETFNPRERSWSTLGKGTKLGRSVKRKSYMYGSVEIPGIKLGTYGEDK